MKKKVRSKNQKEVRSKNQKNMSKTQESSAMAKSVAAPQQQQFWITEKPTKVSNKSELMKRNKKLLGRRRMSSDDVRLYTDIDKDMMKDLASVPDDDDFRYCFTVAPPYLERDDDKIVYVDAAGSKPGSRLKRFASTSKKSKESFDKWDSSEIVSEQLLDRQQVKDVRNASRNLIEFEAKRKFISEPHSMENPTFSQPVYGFENLEWTRQVPQISHATMMIQYPDQGDNGYVYIPAAKIPRGVNPANFLYGKEAYQCYIDMRGQLDIIQREEIEPEIKQLRHRLVQKRDKIGQTVHKAREFYTTNYTTTNFTTRFSLKQRFMRIKNYFTDPTYKGPKELQPGYSQVNLRMALESLPVYTPWFIYAITLLQAISIAILCVSSGVVAPRLSPRKISIDKVKTWGGKEPVEHFIPANPWAGPSLTNLIRSGALYAPCVRQDKGNLLRNAIYNSKNKDLGCCESPSSGAGTTSELECTQIKVLFKNPKVVWRNVTCPNRVANKETSYVSHIFRPCCLGGKGECVIVSHKHCVVLGGVWHITGVEHCSEAHCDSDVCKVYEHTEHESVTESTSQFWRLPLSLAFHSGILHMIVFGILQGVVGSKLEALAGWLRVAMIYFTCGLGGLLLGVIKRPYSPTVGSGGAICGLISVQAIELIQAWPLVSDKQKRNALIRVIMLYVMMFFLGLLPGVNQFTNLGGAFLGILCYFAVMPYVAFTAMRIRIMNILRVIAWLLIIIYLALCFYLFYITQPESNTSLNFLNCLAFIPFACDDDLP